MTKLGTCLGRVRIRKNNRVFLDIDITPFPPIGKAFFIDQKSKIVSSGYKKTLHLSFKPNTYWDPHTVGYKRQMIIAL